MKEIGGGGGGLRGGGGQKKTWYMGRVVWGADRTEQTGLFVT